MKAALGVACMLLMSGGVLALCGVVGRFDAQYSYCSSVTSPCTQVTAPVWFGSIPHDARLQSGSGFTRTITSLLGVGLSGVSILISAGELHKEELAFAQARNAKVLEAASSVLLNKEELEKVAIASQMRVKDFQRELTDGYAYLHLEKNPHLVEELTMQDESPVLSDESSREFEAPVSLALTPESLTPEPEETKIPSAIQMMLDSDLREIVDAGILNLVGAQGSGKTSTSCMLLRYRVWRSHKLIIINPHKKKAMYKGLESHLVDGTKFYGIGIGDIQRAISLLEGIDTVLKLLEKRYNDYQNLEEHEFNHFPVTILLEECAEYAGLLSVLNRPAIKDADDPGFKASKYLEGFWLKLFVASRKGNAFVIRTIQSDTNKTNGTEGLSELIKGSGACTLTQFSVPDGECIGGWRSTGQGEMKIPNQKYIDANGNAIDAKPCIVPTYFDYIKVLKDISNFSDLIPIPEHEETVQSSETIDENPEDLWYAAVQHLKKSLAADSNLKSMDLTGITGQVSDTENHSETTETTIPDGEQALIQTRTYTPDSLTLEQVVTKIQYHQHQGVSQTKIIELLWRVQKNRSGWKAAYKEFKEVML